MAQIETLDGVLDLCDAALDQDATHDLALAILLKLKLADAYGVTVSPQPHPLD